MDFWVGLIWIVSKNVVLFCICFLTVWRSWQRCITTHQKERKYTCSHLMTLNMQRIKMAIQTLNSIQMYHHTWAAKWQSEGGCLVTVPLDCRFAVWFTSQTIDTSNTHTHTHTHTGWALEETSNIPTGSSSGTWFSPFTEVQKSSF